MKNIFMVLSAAACMAACGDQLQTAGNVKHDAAPYTGTGKPYADKGWKAGDKAGWESHLKVRTQNGQNDYTKTN